MLGKWGLFPVALFTFSAAQASIVFSDDFAYDAGPLVSVSNGKWKTHSGTPEQAAVRETHEEMGYEIAIERFVGSYTHQSVYGSGDQETKAFRGHVIGGKLKRFGLESTELKWIDVHQLPRGLEPLRRFRAALLLCGMWGLTLLVPSSYACCYAWARIFASRMRRSPAALILVRFLALFYPLRNELLIIQVSLRN